MSSLKIIFKLTTSITSKNYQLSHVDGHGRSAKIWSAECVLLSSSIGIDIKNKLHGPPINLQLLEQ